MIETFFNLSQFMIMNWIYRKFCCVDIFSTFDRLFSKFSNSSSNSSSSSWSDSFMYDFILSLDFVEKSDFKYINKLWFSEKTNSDSFIVLTDSWNAISSIWMNDERILMTAFTLYNQNKLSKRRYCSMMLSNKS